MILDIFIVIFKIVGRGLKLLLSTKESEMLFPAAIAVAFLIAHLVHFK